MFEDSILTSDNAGAFLTAFQLIQDALMKSWIALDSEDYGSEQEILFALRQNKKLIAQCKKIMADDQRTLAVVRSERH